MALFNPLSHQEKDKILSAFGRNLKTAQDDVESIRIWLKKQPHLPEIPKDKMIMAFLLMNKFRIEETKKRLEMYYTIRSKAPEIFAEINPNKSLMRDYLDHSYFVPLPKLTDNFSRVCVFKLNDCDADTFNPILTFASSLNLGEIRMYEDFCLGNIVIHDMGECKFGHLTKTTPALVKKAATIIEKVYTSRTNGLHYINCPPPVYSFLKLLKTVFPPKLGDRIFVHKDLESLCAQIPKSILPVDYGGEEKSLKELNELVKDKFATYKDHFDKLDSLKVDESLRIGDPLTEDIFGFTGNFKKLDVD